MRNGIHVGFSSLLLKNGTLYFAALSVFNVFSALFDGINNALADNAVFGAILMSRFLLNLHDLAFGTGSLHKSDSTILYASNTRRRTTELTIPDAISDEVDLGTINVSRFSELWDGE
ncbi:hypothetical protein AcV5_002418 [Taiwanofungus camphoratus]|nr:hypothetical protein AcV5_002418 [Antrodia cinnamomea]